MKNVTVKKKTSEKIETVFDIQIKNAKIDAAKGELDLSKVVTALQTELASYPIMPSNAQELYWIDHFSKRYAEIDTDVNSFDALCILDQCVMFRTIGDNILREVLIVAQQQALKV